LGIVCECDIETESGSAGEAEKQRSSSRLGLSSLFLAQLVQQEHGCQASKELEGSLNLDKLLSATEEHKMARSVVVSSMHRMTR